MDLVLIISIVDTLKVSKRNRDSLSVWKMCVPETNRLSILLLSWRFKLKVDHIRDFLLILVLEF